MPDQTTPSIVPPSEPTSNTYVPLPNNGLPSLKGFDDWENNLALKSLGPTKEEFAQSISSGESITDLINDVQNIQAQNDALVANGYPQQNYGTYSRSG